jgi:hypothetical protein
MTRQPVEQAAQRRQAELDSLRREPFADGFNIYRDTWIERTSAKEPKSATGANRRKSATAFM